MQWISNEAIVSGADTFTLVLHAGKLEVSLPFQFPLTDGIESKARRKDYIINRRTKCLDQGQKAIYKPKQHVRKK